ncbi:hypothetical protein BB987_09175 [Photorhabdus temperata]|uniref:Uncharacterized protein n=1 Tax=Photorhabdus khanii NC19 TaxID=1004151 RepID=W3V573_9GAMM|nr:hypothetical protein [Photorhabdus khanii]ETS31071.1 hypothetical protein PTE_03022 [Photorhabdus khanii NC19]OHV54880.1 hypothetical protein BB987_09175 [Photorhabdus temperata]
MEIKKPILASIHLDASELKDQINTLVELLRLEPCLLEGIRDEFLGIIFGLLDDVILTDGLPAFTANGSIDITYFLKFDLGSYNKVIAAMRARVVDLTHG